MYKGCGILVMLFILVVCIFNFQCRSLHETKMPQKKHINRFGQTNFSSWTLTLTEKKTKDLSRHIR